MKVGLETKNSPYIKWAVPQIKGTPLRGTPFYIWGAWKFFEKKTNKQTNLHPQKKKKKPTTKTKQKTFTNLRSVKKKQFTHQ